MTLMAWLLDENGNILAAFEEYESLSYERPYQTSGNFQLRLARNTKNANLIQKGLIFGVDEPNKPAISQLYRVEQIISAMDGEDASGDVIEVSGRSLSGILEERICLPPAGESHDRVRNMPAEEAMKHYVRNNLGENAAPGRRIPNFVIAEGNIGEPVTYEARYQTVAEVLLEIGTAHNLGWQITFDRETAQYTFDVIRGVERINPPVFDIDLGTAFSQQWLSSDLGKKNYSYVAGQGEGAERVVVTRFMGEEQPEGNSGDYTVSLSGGTKSATTAIYDSYENDLILRKSDSPINDEFYLVGLGTFESTPINISAVGQSLSAKMTWKQSYLSFAGVPSPDTYSVKCYVKGTINGVAKPYVEVKNGDIIPFLAESMNVEDNSTLTVKFELTNSVDEVTPYVTKPVIQMTAYDPYASQEWYFENYDSGRWTDGATLVEVETVDTGGIKLKRTADVDIIDDQEQADFATGTLDGLVATTITEDTLTSGALVFASEQRRRTFKLFEGFENEDPDRGGSQYPFVVSGDWVVNEEEVKGDFMNAHSYRNRVLADGQSSTVTFTFTLPADADNRTFSFWYKTNTSMATTGAYQVWVDDVSKLSSSTNVSEWAKFTHTFTTNGTHTVKFQVRDTTPAGTGSSGRFYIDDVELVYDANYTGYKEYGTRVTAPKQISATGLITYSKISWDADIPFGTWMDVFAAVTYSNSSVPQSGWTQIQNGDPIPGVTETGMGSYYLWIKTEFNASPYIDKTITLKNLKVTVGDGYAPEGTYTSQELYFRNAGVHLNSYITWETEAYPVGSAISAEISYDDGLSWEPVNKGQTMPKLQTGDDITEMSGILRMTLKKGTDGTSPIVKRLIIHINKEYGGYEPTGYERKELFVDARDLEDTESLGGRGKSKLQETLDGSEVFETVINPYGGQQYGGFVYGTDWDLGDTVIIMNRHWNIYQTLRVVGVSVSQSGNTPRPEMTIALGAPWPNLISKIKKLTQDGGTKRI